MIKYKSGYKYQVYEDYTCHVLILPNKKIVSDYLILTPHGELTIYKGYAWDGPSGPTVDTTNFMRGSLIHDALYQLIREGKLNERDRKQADLELKTACLEDGMSKIRAWYVWKSVSKCAASAAHKDNLKKIQIAP